MWSSELWCVHSSPTFTMGVATDILSIACHIWPCVGDTGCGKQDLYVAGVTNRQRHLCVVHMLIEICFLGWSLV
jgi:hypothetical protein